MVNSSPNQDHRLRWIFWLTVTAIVAWLIIENLHTPMIDEDYSLSFGYKGSHVNIYEIFAKVRDQYTHWNARLGEGLSIIWSPVDERIYNVANAAVTFLFFLLLFVFGVGRLPTSADTKHSVMLAGTIVLFMAGLPDPGEIFFWRSGSTNYLWSLTFLLLYLVPFYKLFRGTDVFVVLEDRTKSRLLRLAAVCCYVPFGVVIGHASENASPTAVAFMLCLLSWLALSHKFVCWSFMATLSTSIGTLMLIFAPSTAHRVNFYSKVLGVPPSKADLFIRNAPSTILMWGRYSIIPLLLLGLLAVLLVLARQSSRKALSFVAICLMFSFCSAILLAAAPYQHPRAFLLPFSLLVVACLHISNELGSKTIQSIGMLLIIYLAINIPQLLSIHTSFKVRENISRIRQHEIVSQLFRTSDIVIPSFTTMNKFAYVGSPNASRLQNYYKINQGRHIIEQDQ